MRLTSPSTQYVSIAVAIAATIAALLLWNRVRGPRTVRVLARSGLLIGGYAATAVAVLVSVNIAYGGLIVSVSDLFADLNPPMNQHFRHMHPHHSRVGGVPGPGPSGTPAATPATPGAPAPAATATAPARPTPNPAGVAGIAG
jgi:hypothetical protein